MPTELKKMIERASRCTELLFADRGEILPMWEATTCDNRILLIPADLTDKDHTSAAIRRLFAKEQVVACVFITEAWVAYLADSETKLARKALAGGSLEHYPGRLEVVTFLAENASGMLQAHRHILRGDGKPTLGPLEYLPPSLDVSGRFVDMLPRREKQS